jgi:hypothetical protein
MVKKGEAEASEKDELVKKRKLADAEWTLQKKEYVASEPLVCVEETVDTFHNSLPGRRSFGGFHPYIEQNYREQLDSNRLDGKLSKKKSDETAVSDEEMLARYDNLIGLPRGPNQGQMSSQSRSSSKSPHNQKKKHSSK